MRSEMPERPKEVAQPALERPEGVEELVKPPDVFSEWLPENMEQKGVYKARKL